MEPYKGKLISADSHVVEPPEVWNRKEIDLNFNGKVPPYYQYDKERNQDLLKIDGLPFLPVGLFSAAGKNAEDLSMHGGKVEHFHQGALDPAQRILDQIKDGVDAEILYPTTSMLIYSSSDPIYRNACFQAYNNWIINYCKFNPQRLVGLGMVCLFDVTSAIKEAERVLSQGLRGILISFAPPIKTTYADPHYDPFWSWASENNVPISLHAGSSKAWDDGDKPLLQDPDTKISMAKSNFMGTVTHMQNLLTDLAYEGVFKRYPNLILVSAENDAGWLSYYLERMDSYWLRHRHWLSNDIAELPSNYIKNQVYLTFMRDPIALKNVNANILESDKFMWGNDYPHSESTWPQSRKIVSEDFSQIEIKHSSNILCNNAVKLYNL